MDAGVYFQAGLTLLIIVGLIYCLPYLLKKLGLARQIASGKPTDDIVVKSMTMVDMKHRVAAVEAYGKRHLILLSSHQPVVISSEAVDDDA